MAQYYRIALGISVLFISPMLLSAPLSAHETKNQQEIERITVSASRLAKKDIDQAIAIEFVGRSTLEQDNGQHIAESLNSISGVMLNQLQGGHGHNAAIRMPINYGGYYLYLQDNIPLQSAAFFNHNALWWSSFNSTIKRIEVIKGAGTSLHGSGAIAATINTLTEDTLMHPSGKLQLSVGEYGYLKAKAYYTNAISDNQAIAVSGSSQKKQGYREHTTSQRHEINIKHSYQGDDESLVSSFVVSDLEQQMAAALSVDDFLNQPQSSGLSHNVLASDPLRKSKYYRLSSTWQRVTADNYLISIIPYLRWRSNDYVATWDANMPQQQSQVTSAGFLSTLSFEPTNDSELIVGIDYEHSVGELVSFQATTGWGGNTFIAGHSYYDDKTTYVGISPYFQYQQALTDQLTLAFGARYDYNNYNFKNNLAASNDDGYGNRHLKNRRDSFKNLSPKASLNYLLDQQSAVYLRYANSFRLPTAASLYHLKSGDSDSLSGGVDIERSNTYEIGYKINRQAFNAQLAIYYMDVDDAIVRAYSELGQSYQTNAGRIVHQGIELSINGQLSDELSVSVAISKSRHKFDRYVVDAGRVDKQGQNKALDLSGNEMKLAPDYIFNSRLVYTPNALSKLTAIAELKSIGDYYMDNKNSKKYAGYSIANLKFNYQVTERLKLYGRVSNIFDKYYAQQAEIAYGREKYSPGAGRTVDAGISYSF